MQVCGVIVDSAPGKARILRAAKAYAASLQVTGLRRYFVMFSMMAFLLFNAVKVWFQSFYNNKYAQKDKRYLYDNMANLPCRWPELYLYSKADKVISYYDVEDMINRRKSLGVHVDSVCWEKSNHVLHLRQYPEEYRDACWEFLDFCLGTNLATRESGLATGVLQETSDEEYLLVNKAR